MDEKEELVYCEICEYGNSYYFDEYDADAWCDKENDAFDLTPIKCKDFKFKQKFKGRYGDNIVDNLVDKEEEYSFNNDNEDKLYDEMVDLLNKQDKEIKKLKEKLTESEKTVQKLFDDITDLSKHLSSGQFSFTYTNNLEEFNQDELILDDNHTHMELEDGKLNIIVFPPDSTPIRISYIVAGKYFVR